MCVQKMCARIICECVYMMHVKVATWWRLGLNVYVCTFDYVRMCVCMCVCMYVYVCDVCECVYVHVCVYVCERRARNRRIRIAKCESLLG